MESGDWVVEIIAVEVTERQPIHAWLEETLNRELYSLDDIENEVTITIPGTAKMSVDPERAERLAQNKAIWSESTGYGKLDAIGLLQMLQDA